MANKPSLYQIDRKDNVATALDDLFPESIHLSGETYKESVEVWEKIPKGHKVALKQIKEREDIIKYGVCIGRAAREIKAGEWVHLHNICSVYDERSAHLDVVTGAPKDTKYE